MMTDGTTLVMEVLLEGDDGLSQGNMRQVHGSRLKAESYLAS